MLNKFESKNGKKEHEGVAEQFKKLMHEIPQIL